MYAIVEIGSKQYKMVPGETVTIDNLPARKKREIDFKNVLLVADNKKVSIGRPLLKGAKVSGLITFQNKGRKIKVYRYKKREDFHRTIGHRQLLTRVLIKEIETGE